MRIPRGETCMYVCKTIYISIQIRTETYYLDLADPTDPTQQTCAYIMQ